jgi:hypothetical protein
MNPEATKPVPSAAGQPAHAPTSYAEMGMPHFPLPLATDGSRVLTCAGLPFAQIEDFDDLRLMPRWKGYSLGNHHLTQAAKQVVKAVNAHAALVEALTECVVSIEHRASHEEMECTVERAKAALALAKGQPQQQL